MRPRAGFAEFDFRGTVHPHSKQKELNESKPAPIVFTIVRKARQTRPHCFYHSAKNKKLWEPSDKYLCEYLGMLAEYIVNR